MNNEIDSQTNKKKIKRKRILLTIIILGILFMGAKYIMDYYCIHDSHETVSTKNMFANKNDYITVSSLKFHVPKDAKIEVGDTYFTVGGEIQEYVIRVEVVEADFQYLIDNIATLRSNLKATYNSKAQIKNYNGKDYITSESANWIFKTLVSFTKATDDKILIISIINKKNTYDYELLNEFTTITNDL